MELTDLDVHDSAQAGEAFALHQAVHEADTPDHPPPLQEPFLAYLRTNHPEFPSEWLAARVGGGLVGFAQLQLSAVDNRHLAIARLEVRPAHRRRGIGQALLERLYQRIDDEQRSTVLCRAVRAVPGGPPRSDAGDRFLTAMGFVSVLELYRRRLDLTTIDQADEQRVLEECLPHAADYELLTWTGHTPNDLAGGVARLVNRLNTDAPGGGLALEPTTLDAERLRADERYSLDRRTHLVWAAARHRPTGDLAAVTRTDVRAAGDHGSVWLTIADPAHRGHRLGTIVKIEVHRLARKLFPDLRYVQTGNADTNRQMAAINDRLGFVAYETGINYQLTR